MDCRKTGRVIQTLRKEKNMTQKQLAETINVSDKAVSKWERGMGCPDVTLLIKLSEILEADIESILSGDLMPNKTASGNIKLNKFYVCPNCNNIISNIGKGDISCCGRILKPLKAKTEDKDHDIIISEIENDYYITIEHEMTKDHYISFAAYITFDRMLLIKLYPEQAPELRFPKMFGGKLYYYCNKEGLYIKDIKNQS